MCSLSRRGLATRLAAVGGGREDGLRVKAEVKRSGDLVVGGSWSRSGRAMCGVGGSRSALCPVCCGRASERSRFSQQCYHLQVSSASSASSTTGTSTPGCHWLRGRGAARAVHWLELRSLHCQW